MKNSEAGIGLIEVLVATLLLMLVGGAMVSNLHFSLRSAKFIEVQHAASTLASDRIEQIAARDVLDISAALNETDTVVPWPGINLSFKRSTTITVKADGSRSVQVSVYTPGANMPKPVVFKNEFYAW